MGQCCGCCCGQWCETLEQRVWETFLESEIIDKEIFWANLKYRKSSGYSQTKGNGAFVVTSQVVWFGLLCPDWRITIPLNNIRAVGTCVGTRGNNLLVLDFVDGVSGIEDQVMIAFREPDHWLRLINEAISKATFSFGGAQF